MEDTIIEQEDWKTKYMYLAAEVENMKKRYAAKELILKDNITKELLELLVFPERDEIFRLAASVADTSLELDRKSLLDGIVTIFKKQAKTL